MTSHDDSWRSETRDGMVIDWDVPIQMSDGLTLRGNLFRPLEGGPYPVLLSHGPYGKDMSLQVGFAPMWKVLEEQYPDALAGSTNKYQCWELVDPEKWVPHGYAILRIDSRGSGRSPGRLDFFSPREIEDFAECIEWAADQAWSSGKVGLAGISYYASAMWHVAGRDPLPRGLVAAAPWEGNSDRYRENGYQGGIPSSFLEQWFTAQVARIQHGAENDMGPHPVSGLSMTGDQLLTQEELAANRADAIEDFRRHPLDGPYWRERSGKIDKVGVPILSCANWGGQGLHLRGNIEGFLRAPVDEKWLEIHGREHWTLFYSDYGVELLRRFFDFYLKGEGDWLESQPTVQLQVRQVDDTFIARGENEWPLARTEWTRYHLDPESSRLTSEPPGDVCSTTYVPPDEGVTFLTEPVAEDIELTGPSSCRLWISSETVDADLFLVLRAFDPAGDEVLFAGSGDPRVPLAQGWLRASHRTLDESRSTPYRPFHSHDRTVPLVPGEPTRLDIEIWPTSILLPAGYCLGLTVLGRDFDHGLGVDTEGLAGLYASKHPGAFRGCGPWVHDDPEGRPAAIYNGAVTIHAGPGFDSFLLLPVIPD